MRLLPHIADLVVKRPAAVRNGAILVLLAAALATAWGAANVTTDYLALLPRGMPEVKNFRETVRDFGSLDYLLVLMQAPEGASADELEETIEAVAAALRDSPHVEAVEYKFDMESPLVTFMARHAFLFLSDEERAEIERRLSPAGIEEQVTKTRQILGTPSSSVIKRFLKLDPLGLLPIIRGHFVSGRTSHGIDLSQGYYLSRDRSSVLLIAKPRRPAQDVSFDEELMADVERRTGEALARTTGEGRPRPAIHFGGGYVIALEDYKILKQDAAVNIGSSFTSVLLLFAFGIGGIRSLKYCALPLAAGILLTGGFGAAALGSFNPATAGFAALLVGLAVDYIIVMYGRFTEERHHGATPEAAARVVVEQTGRSVFLGAVTTAATFLALCTVDFKGLFDLGLLTGVGILLCFAAIIFLVPLMMLRDGQRHHEALAHRLHTLGIERISILARRFPKTVLGCTIGITLACFAAVPRVRFDDDLKALRAVGNRGIEVQRLISDKFGGGFDYLMVITRAPDLEALLARNMEVNRELDRLVAGDVLAAYDSAVKYLPPRTVQEENLAWIRARRAEGLSPASVRGAFEDAAKRHGLKLEPFLDGLGRVAEALDVDAPLTTEVLRENKLGFIVDRYLRQEADGGMKSVTYVFPKKGDFKRFVPEELREIDRRLGDDVDLTGVTVMSQALRGRIRGQAFSAFLLGIALVVVLVFYDLRALVPSLAVLAPLVAGVSWMCGIMFITDVAFNFFNVFVATMILGIGVDYGIHATHRYLERGGADFEGAFLETGKPIILAGLTTVLGFGSFATSHYRGLFSIGLLAIIGVGTCLLACFTLLPALLVLYRTPADSSRPPWRNNDSPATGTAKIDDFSRG